MGLFNFFKRNKKEEPKKEKYEVSNDLLKEISGNAEKYVVNDNFQRTHDRLGQDVFYLNRARFQLELALIRVGEDVDKCYEYRYKASTNTAEEDKDFYYSIMSTVILNRNYMKIYYAAKGNKREALSEGYDKCIEHLMEVSQILKNDEEIRSFLESLNIAEPEKKETVLNNENICTDEENERVVENVIGEGENVIGVDLNSAIEKMAECNSEILDYLSNAISKLAMKDFNECSSIIDIINEKREIIADLAEASKECINKDVLNGMCLEQIISYCGYIKFDVEIIKNEIKMIKLDFDYSGTADLARFKSHANSIMENCNSIREELVEIIERVTEEIEENNLEDNTENESYEIVEGEDTFTLNYFCRYYFYEKEEFIEEWENGRYIYQQICNEGIYEEGDTSYKFTKNEKVVLSKTVKDAVLEIDRNLVSVKINGQRIYLDLKYKFEITELAEEVKIHTMAKEAIDSISTMIYVDKKIGNEFIEALRIVEKNQIRNRQARN